MKSCTIYIWNTRLWAPSKGIISNAGFEVQTAILQRVFQCKKSKSVQGLTLFSVRKEGDVLAPFLSNANDSWTKSCRLFIVLYEPQSLNFKMLPQRGSVLKIITFCVACLVFITQKLGCGSLVSKFRLKCILPHLSERFNNRIMKIDLGAPPCLTRFTDSEHKFRTKNIFEKVFASFWDRF